jgi:phosphatidylglycerol:prolipoprotein diacylglycerol transferase
MISLNYYGFVYSLGFLVFYYYIQKSKLKEKDFYFLGNLAFSLFFARLFHVLDLNNLNYYIQNPLEIVKVWKGGLAWFGGVFGFLLFNFLYLKKEKKERKELKRLIDKTILFVPIFIMVGRIANYFNQENKGIGFLGLPQQIFEGLSQGLLLFLIVLFSKNRTKSFIISYCLIRLFTEFFRIPVGFKKNHFIIFLISLIAIYTYDFLFKEN